MSATAGQGSALPEPWLRGPIADVPRELQPAAHALVYVAENVAQSINGLTVVQLEARPGGSASIAYHVHHLVGSTDRLLTYARGEVLSEAQRAALAAESRAGGGEGASHLIGLVSSAVESAVAQLRSTPVDRLFEAREVGRARLPSSVFGLLCHVAEHAARHAGQIATLAKIVR